ncbi:MAG TPA: inositol monophosphatase family protein [Acidimicrobiales bacterium]|nr:inositol monophosphatase family protein [Acidimicrobiales bacterium]
MTTGQGPRHEEDLGDPAFLRSLVELAGSIAREAGQVLADRFSAAGPAQGVTDSVRSKSTLTDLVTEADQASERLIVSRLLAERPTDAIVAEEGSSREGTSGLTWVVDPLDGTINFVYGFPVFAVSIACRSSQGPTAAVGVVHDPVRDETFSAVSGGGAFRDGVRLALGPAPELGEALVGTGFSYQSARRRAQAALLGHVLPRVRDIRRAGAAALDLCWVAAGRLDGFYEAGLAPWDLAAGSLIVTEAGGTVEQLDGLLRGHGDVSTLIAAAPGLGAPLRELLRGARAE